MEYDENIIDIRKEIYFDDLMYQSYNHSKHLIFNIEERNLRIEEVVNDILDICKELKIEYNNGNYPLEYNLKQYYYEKELISLRSYLKYEDDEIPREMLDELRKKNWKVDLGREVLKYIK